MAIVTYSPGEMLESTVVAADVFKNKDASIIIDYDTAEFNHSWLVRIGDDRNRSYFTFYSEFNRRSPKIVYVEIFFLLLLTLVSTIGNFLITYVVLSNRKMRTNTNLFIANMCVADILFTLTNPVIAVVRYQGSWELGVTCGFLLYTQVVCGVVLIWSMALISMDKYRRIVIGTRLYKHLTELAAKIAISVCWILSFGLAIPFIIYFKVEEFDFGTDKVKICTLMWPIRGEFERVSAVFVPILVILSFVIPFTLILYNYISILKILYETRNRMINHMNTQIPKKKHQTDDKSKRQNVRLSAARNRRDFKNVMKLVSTVVIFGLMWLPMFVIFLLIAKDGITEAMRTSSWGFLLAACIAFANACVNPIIYGLFYENFRLLIKKLFCRIPPTGTEQQESTRKSNISSVSGALAEIDKTARPSSSSEEFKDSCASIAESVKTAETQLEE